MFGANKSPALLCRDIATPLWSPRSSCQGYKNLPHIFRCLSPNQSPVRCGGSFLRAAPAIHRLITWQPLWEPRGSASPAGFSALNKSLTPYTCTVVESLLWWTIYYFLRLCNDNPLTVANMDWGHILNHLNIFFFTESYRIDFCLCYPVIFNNDRQTAALSYYKDSLSQGTKLWLDLFVKGKFKKKRVDSIKRIYTMGANMLFYLAVPGKLMDSRRWNPPI